MTQFLGQSNRGRSAFERPSTTGVPLSPPQSLPRRFGREWGVQNGGSNSLQLAAINACATRAVRVGRARTKRSVVGASSLNANELVTPPTGSAAHRMCALDFKRTVAAGRRIKTGCCACARRILRPKPRQAAFNSISS